MRVVGAGHSFSPLAATDDVLISLEQLQGLEGLDAAGGTATVLAGTTLHALGRMLHAHGFALENLGGIDAQTLGGAISTGTHGTGIRFGSLSTQVEGMTLLTAAGDCLDCSPARMPDLFRAAQLSLGTLGIVTTLTLRVVPAKRLSLDVRRERLGACLGNLDRYVERNSHFEFFWFPGTDWVQAKFLNETEAPRSVRRAAAARTGLTAGIYRLASECCRLAPPLSAAVSALSARAAGCGREVDFSHRLFLTPFVVRAQAMEYAVAARDARSVLREIETCISRHRFRVHVPLGCRFVRGDDIWLSPAYQRDSVYIAAHAYRGMPYESYFRELEAILQGYGGRPHWGKIHSLGGARLADLYPRWHQFRRIRADLDPRCLFLNDHLRSLFEPGLPAPPEPCGSVASR